MNRPSIKSSGDLLKVFCIFFSKTTALRSLSPSEKGSEAEAFFSPPFSLEAEAEVRLAAVQVGVHPLLPILEGERLLSQTR